MTDAATDRRNEKETPHMQPSSGNMPAIARQCLVQAGVYDLVACETYLASRRIRIPLDDGRGGVTHVSCWPPRQAVGRLPRHPGITIVRIDPSSEDEAAVHYALIRRPNAAYAHPLGGVPASIDADAPVSIDDGAILIGNMTVGLPALTAT